MQRKSKSVLICWLSIWTTALLLTLGTDMVTVAANNDAIYTTEGGTWIQVDENTWTMDTDFDEEPDVTLVKKADQWEYSFKVKDTGTNYFVWETAPFDEYLIEGKGTRANPVEYIMKGYSHTANISDDGTQNGIYGYSLNTNDVVTIPDAKKIHIKLTYAQRISSDYVCMWEGNHPDYKATINSDTAIEIDGIKRFSGTKETTVECDIEGDSVTFGFRSSTSTTGTTGYGYYAVVTRASDEEPFIVNTKKNYVPPTEMQTGTLSLTKNLAGVDASDTLAPFQNFRFDITLASDDCLSGICFAEWRYSRISESSGGSGVSDSGGGI